MLRDKQFKNNCARVFTCISAFVIGICVMSCQDYLQTDGTASSLNIALEEDDNKDIDLMGNIPSEWFSFDSITSSPEWKSSEDITWRVAQIQIPEEELASIPTSVLLGLCLDYPFSLDYTAANDCADGISRLMATFNGFGELAKREDAVETFISYIDTLDISEIVENSKDVEKFSTREGNILYVNYIELLLSQIVSAQNNSDNILDAENAFQKIYKEKLKHSDVFGSYSLEASNVLDNCIQSVMNTKSQSALLTTNSLLANSGASVTIYTTYGKTLTGIFDREELTASEISSMNSYYRLHYLSATFLSSSSNLYNCHSYAWNISNGGLTCWIEGSNFGQPDLSNGNTAAYNDNISAYWTDGQYSTTGSHRAEKIYYYRGDHSAVKSSESGKYESKWGQGPLMRHSPTNCPSIYNPDFRSYMKTVDLFLVCSAGAGEISVNETCTYSAEDLPDGLSNSYRWEVLDDKNEEDIIGTYATLQNPSANNATITFTRRGIYYVKLYRNHPYRGEMVYSLDVYIVPGE